MSNASTKENIIEDYLVERAKDFGGSALKLRPPTGRGFPDRTVTLPHSWVAFVETKRPIGGRIAAHQTKWADDLRQAGQRVYFVRTKDEVDEIFNDYRKDIDA